MFSPEGIDTIKLTNNNTSDLKEGTKRKYKYLGWYWWFLYYHDFRMHRFRICFKKVWVK